MANLRLQLHVPGANELMLRCKLYEMGSIYFPAANAGIKPQLSYMKPQGSSYSAHGYINNYRKVSNIRHKIPKLKWFSSGLEVVFAQPFEARC